MAGLVFGAMHMNIWVFLPMFVGGVGFAWPYDKKHNLYINILAHITWNTISMALYLQQTLIHHTGGQAAWLLLK